MLLQFLESFKVETFFKQDFVSCFQIYRVKSLSITTFAYMLGHFHCLILCDPREPAKLLCPWDSPGKNTGVGCHALLQGIFPT